MWLDQEVRRGYISGFIKMATKIVFRNNSGAITVDGTYKNLQYHSKTNINGGELQLLPLNAPMPNLWALHSPNGMMMCPALVPGAGAKTTEHINRWSVSGSGERYEFCRKDFIKASPGINIYNEYSGELMFSSNIKPMRVVDAISGVANMSGGSVLLERTYNNSRKYAVVMGSVPVRLVAGSNVETYCPRIQTSGGYVKISIELMTYANAGRYRFNFIAPNFNFLVVDVTGY